MTNKQEWEIRNEYPEKIESHNTLLHKVLAFLFAPIRWVLEKYFPDTVDSI